MAGEMLDMCGSRPTERRFRNQNSRRTLLRQLNRFPPRWGERIMIDTVVIQPEAGSGEPSVSGVSWPAIAAGAVVSCAVTLVVLAFGVGLGLSVVSPWTGAGVPTTTFKIGTGLYLVVVAMFA